MTARSVVVVVVVVAVVVVACAGCTTSAPTAPPTRPMITVKELSAGARGAVCGGRAELQRGAVPADARVIAEIELSSEVPQSLLAFEELARLKAMELCASNVSLLRAVDSDGHGILAVTAALWERPLPTP